MTPEQFIILNFFILVGFAGLFFWGRSTSKSPSSLNLTSSSESKKLEAHDAPQKIGITSDGQETLGEILSENLKDINPMFIYNGHSWDAFEVLGIIPGSSIDSIREAFKLAIQKSDPSSHEFLKAALATILSGMKKQGYGKIK